MNLRAKWKAALRVSGVLFVVALVAGVVGVRHAEARLGEALFSASATFLGPLGADERPRHLFMNGLRFEVTSRTLSEGLDDVLDRFERTCRARTVRFPIDGISPTLRLQGESEGVIACIDTGERVELPEFWERLDAVVESGDLAKLGGIRYLYASERSGKTTVLLLASEGELSVRDAFPKTGDAPGINVGPRPEGTTRLLSAFEQGHPYAVAAYRTEPGVEWSPERLGAFLRSEGFSVEPTSERSLFAKREGETYVVASRGSKAKGTTFTVVRLDG